MPEPKQPLLVVNVQPKIICGYMGLFEKKKKKWRKIQLFLTICSKTHKHIYYTLRKKKGTKAVPGAVPFQKVNFCPF